MYIYICLKCKYILTYDAQRTNSIYEFNSIRVSDQTERKSNSKIER